MKHDSELDDHEFFVARGIVFAIFIILAIAALF